MNISYIDDDDDDGDIDDDGGDDRNSIQDASKCNFSSSFSCYCNFMPCMTKIRPVPANTHGRVDR